MSLNSINDLYSSNYLSNIIGGTSSCNSGNNDLFNLVLYTLLTNNNNATNNHCCCCHSHNEINTNTNTNINTDTNNRVVENTVSSNINTNTNADTLFETINTTSKKYLYNIDGDTNLQVNSGNKEWDARIESAIRKSSEKYGIDEDLIKTIIKIESNFNPNVTSKAGAKGLMQLMPINIKTYNVNDPYNIEENIDAGTQHIKEYLDMFKGDLDMALIAYNYGPGNMKKRGITSLDDLYKAPKETQNYIMKVNKYYTRKISNLQTV